MTGLERLKKRIDGSNGLLKAKIRSNFKVQLTYHFFTAFNGCAFCHSANCAQVNRGPVRWLIGIGTLRTQVTITGMSHN
jgi:cytochrome c1